MLYSLKKLNPKDLEFLEQALDNIEYICGAELDINKEIFINPKDECNVPISIHYYDLGTKPKDISRYATNVLKIKIWLIYVKNFYNAKIVMQLKKKCKKGNSK
jgi:hypothetical protein